MENNNFIIEIYGSDHDDGKKTIIELIKKYNIKNIVTLHGPVYEKDKIDILLDSDFFILTSRFEGHSMGLIEALSYGIPSLITTGTNMAEEIEEFGAGWTSDNNVESIVKALKLIINKKESIADKGEAALKLSERYSWEIIAKKTKEEYKRLLANL